MIKKKCKMEYDFEEVKAQLRKLIVDENIINNQKCYIYTQLKIYKELYIGLQRKYEELESENADLYEQINSKGTTSSISKENIKNTNTEIDDSFNMTENIKNKLNEYTDRLKNQYDDENSTTFDKLSKLRLNLKEKDEKIVELENTIIKLQILARSNNVKNDTEEVVDEDELINLKTRVEYSQIEKERLIINSNNKIMETKIKYEEFMKKYDNLSENFNNSLIKIEDLKNIVKDKDKKKIDYLYKLEEKFTELKNDIIDTTEKLNILSRYYQDYKNLFVVINKQNLDLLMKLKNYKILESKKNNKTGEDFYDEEISNLLEVCDSLTDENKKLIFQIKELEKNVAYLESEKSKIEHEKDSIMVTRKSFILKYVEDLNQQKKIISEHLQEIKVLTEEKNRLIRLNVDRIKVSDKYKDELRIKNIENVCLEKKNEDIEKMLSDFKLEIYERLSSNRRQLDVKPCIMCNLCDTNPKDVAIISCMHTFCENCINLRIKLRDRKCPTCGNSFHVSDVKRLYL